MNTFTNAINDLRITINNPRPSSAWERGVRVYANELLDELLKRAASGCMVYGGETLDGLLDRNGNDFGRIYRLSGDPSSRDRILETALLNGARNWAEYSERLCAPARRRERWLDMQARALWQASQLIAQACCHLFGAAEGRHA